jgi:beta-lactamase class D
VSPITARAVLLFAVAACGEVLAFDRAPEVSRLFEQGGIQGTFVLYDVSQRKLTGHNVERANKRFVPASTYKIAHTLIGLSVGAIAGVDEVLPYGGKPQPFKSWERDMSLREAIAISNAAVYQELARRIGIVRMKEWIGILGYGNREIGPAVDQFWLTGPLAISAVEQVEFLARFAEAKLPASEGVLREVREIIRLESGNGWILYGKTGWENAPNPGVGWWVGWVQRGEQIFVFALNLDIHQTSDAGKRLELGKASLRALGIL